MDVTYEIEKLCHLKKMVLRDYGEPWITREIVEVLNDKKTLFLKAKRTKLPEDYQAAKPCAQPQVCPHVTIP